MFPSERQMHHLITTPIHCGCSVTCKCPALGWSKPKIAVFHFSQPADLVCCPYAADLKHEVLLSRPRLYLNEKRPVSPALIYHCAFSNPKQTSSVINIFKSVLCLREKKMNNTQKCSLHRLTNFPIQ